MPVTTGLDVLGGFALRVTGVEVAVPPVGQRLLALLAVHGRPVTRQGLAATLWPDSPDDQGQASLRSALWRLSRRVDRLVVAGSATLRLADDVCVDYAGAGRAAQALLRGTDEPQLTCLGSLSADLLPEWCDDWVLLERERHRQRRLHALEALCRQLTTRREYGLALEAGLAAVAAEPLRESAHRAVVAAHLAEGNRVEALRQFRSCRLLLRDELGAEPSRALSMLLEAS